MWRVFVFAVICALFTAACGVRMDERMPEWDATATSKPTAAQPSSTPMPALGGKASSPTPLPSLQSQATPDLDRPIKRSNALPMVELLSTAVAPTRTFALNAYAPPPPMPFTPGAEQTEFGIQINACDHGVDQALPILKRLGVRWAKLQVRWGDMQYGPDRINWSCTDDAIPKLRANGFKILASVVTAPAFLRLLPRVNGPPDNFDDYAIFLHTLISRYPSQIQAIEVWNEPNLSAEWDWQIDGAVYRHLLASAYVAVKSVDPTIMVISGALAPTGFGSVWTHVDDRSFIAKFRRYNGDAYTDCVGAHANGPEGVGDIDHVASNYYDWFDRAKPICVTEFGYGLPVEGQAPKGLEWIMRHTAEKQVKSFTDGFAWARVSGYVRLVIVWSLDYWGPPSDPNAPYALVRPGWESTAIETIALFLSP